MANIGHEVYEDRNTYFVVLTPTQEGLDMGLKTFKSKYYKETLKSYIDFL